MTRTLRPSQSLAATIGQGAADPDALVLCSQCGLEGPPSTKVPGWCKACGISAALARWHAYQEATTPAAPAPVVEAVVVELPPPEAPRFARQPRPRRERRAKAVAPLAPWERLSEALCRRIVSEEDEASREALRVELLRARYTPWRQRGGRA